MVSPTVAVFHFKGIRTCRKRHKLMSQTDRKDRNIGLIQLADLLDNTGTFLRISRSVAQHNTVRCIRDDLFRRGECRVNRNITASRCKRSCNIFLCSKIEQGHLQPLAVQFSDKTRFLLSHSCLIILCLEHRAAGNRSIVRKALRSL